jgi:hypothetical protein
MHGCRIGEGLTAPNSLCSFLSSHSFLLIPDSSSPATRPELTPSPQHSPESSMSASILAVQHLRRMRGGSQSHLLRASDGAYYVTKFAQ